MSTNNQLLDAALALAARDVPVFPCDPRTKHPLPPADLDATGKKIQGTGGHKKATTDPKQITTWWTRWPGAAIGTPTGTQQTGVVCDIDNKNGKDGFAAVPDWESLSPMIVATPNDGRHLWFRYEGSLKSTSSQIAPGVDTRGDNAYVLVPPSPGYHFVKGNFGCLGNLPPWPEKYSLPVGEPAVEHVSRDPSAPIEKITVALQRVPNNDADWETWNTIGMAIFRATDGDPDGLDLFDRWSQKSSKYHPDDCLARWEHWQTSSPPTKIGAPTIFHLADKAGTGWRDEPGARPAAEDEFPEITLEPPKTFAGVPLTIRQWEARDIPPLDPLLGELITTTTRAELIAPTGLGKTNFSMSLAMHIAAGKNFLHWCVPRPARVLYIDGEMSRRLYKQRILDAADMLGAKPIRFFGFNHEDLPGFAPLNTKTGQAQIDALIEHVGGVDFAVFDSVMCLTFGDMKDEESWQQTLPWMRKLTRKRIGQLWVHHTGHDEKRGYGTKTREWQLDVVMMMQREDVIEAPVAFTLSFPKARERAPHNAPDFAPMKVWLSHKSWHHRVVNGGTSEHVPPMAAKFFRVLRNIATVDKDSLDGCASASLDDWKAACIKNGLIDSDAKPNSQRATFAKYKTKLIEANWIRCDVTTAWVLK